MYRWVDVNNTEYKSEVPVFYKKYAAIYQNPDTFCCQSSLHLRTEKKSFTLSSLPEYFKDFPLVLFSFYIITQLPFRPLTE